MLYQKIQKCRICGNRNLQSIVHLGRQALTGVFPRKGEQVESGPLELVKCMEKSGSDYCGLLQLAHNYNMEKMYGENYGYRSGLNQSMVKHLQDIVKKIEKRIDLKKSDLVIDIASNDGTLLGSYRNTNLQLVGIDPTAKKFGEYYKKHTKYIADFYSSSIVRKNFGNKKARVITSIAMFYDLPDPLSIMKQIYEVLADDGIWVVEQSYMPNMLDNVSYDTICHEHLEYYRLKQFVWMAEEVGLKIIDVSFNDTNGASFCLTLAKKESVHKEAKKKIGAVLQEEEARGLEKLAVYAAFAKHTQRHQKELLQFFRKAKRENKQIFGYGASTKGNVILQYCGLTKDDMPYIAEVNEYKFGRVTPGTAIPIISEKEARAMHPNYFLVLPWHFRDGIIKREAEFLKAGGRLVFPLPRMEIV